MDAAEPTRNGSAPAPARFAGRLRPRRRLRLSPLDSSFVIREDVVPGYHGHAASVALFEGPAPSPEALAEHVAGRLDRIPRSRQRMSIPPGRFARAVWVTSPPGEMEALYYQCRAALDVAAVGFLTPGLTRTFAVVTHDDSANVPLIGDRGLIADLDEIAARLRDEARLLDVSVRELAVAPGAEAEAQALT